MTYFSLRMLLLCPSNIILSEIRTIKLNVHSPLSVFFIYLLFSYFLIGWRSSKKIHTHCAVFGEAWWKVNSRANKRRTIHHAALQSVINHRRRLWSLGNAVWVASLDYLRTQTAQAAFVLSRSSRPLRSASMVTPIFTSHLSQLSRQTGALFLFFYFVTFVNRFAALGNGTLMVIAEGVMSKAREQTSV